MLDIIYGKNKIQRIVAIEPKNEIAEIFIENENGNVEKIYVKNRYWILTNKPLKNWVRLQGYQYYKFGQQYTNYNEYLKDKYYLSKDLDIFTISDVKESLMVKDGYTYFKGMNPKELSILSIDLETTTLDPDNPDAMIILISTTFRKNNKVIKKLFSYDEFENEAEMIEKFCEYVIKCDPSCIIGHNIYYFDLNYLYKRALNNNIKLRIGRDLSEPVFSEYYSKFRVDGSKDIHYKKVRIYGREIIDTMFLAYKYDIGRKYESYGLKKIIEQENLQKKDRVFYDASRIRFNYMIKEELEKIKKYCEDDADDALALFDLMIPAFFYMTQMIPKSFQSIIESASGSQLNSLMVRAYLQNAHSIAKSSEVEKFEGAISFGIPGIYKNALKIDITSLYPSLILQYKIYDKNKDPKGYLYEITKYLREERIKNKKLAKETGNIYYSNLEQAQKVLINSLYGFMGAAGLNYNSPKCAALITEKGRDILKYSIELVTNEKAEKIIMRGNHELYSD